jgi:hypothetical protein
MHSSFWNPIFPLSLCRNRDNQSMYRYGKDSTIRTPPVPPLSNTRSLEGYASYLEIGEDVGYITTAIQ